MGHILDFINFINNPHISSTQKMFVMWDLQFAFIGLIILLVAIDCLFNTRERIQKRRERKHSYTIRNKKKLLYKSKVYRIGDIFTNDKKYCFLESGSLLKIINFGYNYDGYYAICYDTINNIKYDVDLWQLNDHFRKLTKFIDKYPQDIV